MKIRTLLLASALLAGCTGGSSPSPHSDLVSQGVIAVNHDIEVEEGPGSGLHEGVSEMNFTLLDGSGRAIPGSSVTLPRREWLQFPAPAGATTLQIDYLRNEPTRGRAVVVSSSRVPVDVPSGGEARVTMDGDPTAPVHFAQSNGQWFVVVNGNSVVLKGAGFDYALGTDTADPSTTTFFSYVDPDLKNAGVNAIRTYGSGWNFVDPAGQAKGIGAMLKFAADNSTPNNRIMVLAGLVYAPSQGDMETLIPQTVALVQGDPNYAHLLGWAIGNENPAGDYPGINRTLGLVKAKMTTSALVRPVTSVVTNVSPAQVAVLEQQLPNMDWLGINSFYGKFDATHAGGGFLTTQADDLATGGWTLPWAITEYYSYDLPSPAFGGTPGMPSQTLNGQPYYLELNSTLNAQNYADSYSKYIVGSNARSKGSVGGFVLNWGPPHNSKLMAFWKMVYCYRGEFKPFVNPPYSLSGFDRLAAADAVAAQYGGSLSANACPQIVLPADGDRQGIACSFKATLTQNPTPVAPGAPLTASVTATDPNGDPLTFDWYLVGGTAEGFSGNIDAAQKDPTNYINTTSIRLGGGTSSTASGQTTNTLDFNARSTATAGNNYQLRVIVRDGQGGAATAAIGFPMQAP